MNAPTLEVIQGGRSSSLLPIPGTKRPCLRLLTDADLSQLPDPRWLIDPIIEQGSLTVLYGPPGVGKSFLALDWTLSVQTGKPWLGRSVAPGSTLYIAAEGATGLKKRVKVWKDVRNGSAAVGTVFLPEAVQLMKPADLSSLIQCVKGHQPTGWNLIVVDTLSRCFVGGVENAPEDMGRFVDACARVQRETGAAVLIIHHCTKKGLDLRGSSVLAGAADTILFAKKNGNTITVTCKKQKNAEEFKPIKVSLTAAGDSCIVAPCDSEKEGRSVCKPHLRPTLSALEESGDKGLSWTEWLKASGKPEQTFGKHLNQLGEDDYIELQNGIYRVTEKGRAALL